VEPSGDSWNRLKFLVEFNESRPVDITDAGVLDDALAFHLHGHLRCTDTVALSQITYTVNSFADLHKITHVDRLTPCSLYGVPRLWGSLGIALVHRDIIPYVVKGIHRYRGVFTHSSLSEAAHVS